MESSPYCDMCRDLGRDDDCQACDNKPPELMLVNEAAYLLWCHCQTQWRYSAYGAGGCLAPMPCGLDYGALVQVADLLDLGEVTPSMFLKIQALENEEIAGIRRRLSDGSK